MKPFRFLLLALAVVATSVVATADAQMLLLTLDTPNPQASGNFGHSVAVGDVNGDGKADIAVGAHSQVVGGNEDQGRAYVFSGSNGSLLFTLDIPNPQGGAYFGHSVALGDVNDDAKADIAVGAVFEDVGGNEDQGRAYVFSGADGSLLFTLDTPNPQAVAWFGYSLAVGDVDGDGKADIAVGAHREDIGGNEDQGRAYVFSEADGSLLFTVDLPNPQAVAWFGVSLAVGDVNGDGKADVAVGALYEDVAGNDDQGRAYVFSGADGSLLFTLDTPNPQAYAHFSRSLAVGEIDGDGKGDIAVGASGEDVGGNVEQGRAYVFSGADGSLLFTLDTPNPQAYVYFGRSLAVGDLNGDGKGDIAVGAPRQNVAYSAQGRAYAFSLASGCEPGVDTDFDGFDDDVECYLGTDPLDDCPDDPSHDAWPPDIDMNTQVNVLDIQLYKPGLSGPYDARYDLDASGEVDVLDILLYKPWVNMSCANP
jgi:hypothetical protein